MSYSELPGIKKEKVKYGLTFEGFTTLKGCCLEDISLFRPSLIGQRLKCSKCGNLVTAKESNIKIWDNENQVVMPGQVKDFAKDIQVHSIQYSKPWHTEAMVAEDVKKMGIKANYVSTASASYTVIQIPADWFEKSSIHIVTPRTGVTILAGKVKREYRDKIPNTTDLKDQRPPNPIEKW